MMIQAGKFNDWPSPIQISVAYWMGVFIEFANEKLSMYIKQNEAKFEEH